MTQTRENTNVRGLKPVEQVMKGAKKKGPYANSITESKVNEDDLAEQDLIVIPGQGRLKRTGFVKHDLDQGEHEGHTLKNSLHTIARAASDLDKRLSVQSEFPEWVSEKIGAAKGMMVSVMDYLISSQEMQHDSDAMSEGDYPDGSSIKTSGSNDWQQQYQQAVMAVKNAKTQQEYEAASARAGSIKDLLASKGIKVGAVLGQQTVAENYPKHQDLSGISTDKLKAYITKQGQQQVSGEGNQVKRVRAELERRMKGVAEAKADPTGSWVVYNGSKVTRFKTHSGAKAYAEKNGGQVASSEYYHDKIQKQGVAEGYKKK